MRGPNQKPLTIKPYPMKIHDEYSKIWKINAQF